MSALIANGSSDNTSSSTVIHCPTHSVRIGWINLSNDCYLGGMMDVGDVSDRIIPYSSNLTAFLVVGIALGMVCPCSPAEDCRG
jgi:hypothetical protein